MSVKDWEEKLSAELWKGISHYIFENVYLPAGYSVNQTNSTGKSIYLFCIILIEFILNSISSIIFNFIFKTDFVH